MKIRSAEFICSSVTPRSYPEEGMTEIAFVGRSNVGKSTLMNRLLNRTALVKVSSTPGKTRTINFFLVNGSFRFVDLPGYGFAKVPRQIQATWRKMIETYLVRRVTLAGVVLLVDIRREPMADDLRMRDWLGAHGIPSLIVATKADKVKSSEKARSLSLLKRIFGTREVIPFSGLTGEGKGEVWKALRALIKPADQDEKGPEITAEPGTVPGR